METVSAIWTLVLLATARQLATPAFATWRSPAGESEIQKRCGETWRSLSKFPRITDIDGCIKYYLWFSVSQNSTKFELQAKIRKDTPYYHSSGVWKLSLIHAQLRQIFTNFFRTLTSRYYGFSFNSHIFLSNKKWGWGGRNRDAKPT